MRQLQDILVELDVALTGAQTVNSRELAGDLWLQVTDLDEADFSPILARSSLSYPMIRAMMRLLY